MSIWRLLRSFATWSVHYPPLLIAYLLLAAAVWSNITDPLSLRRIGVPNIFWHEEVFLQVLAGFASCLFLGHLSFIGWLLDSDPGENVSAVRKRWTILAYLITASPFPVLVAGLVIPSLLDLSRGVLFATGCILGSVALVLFTTLFVSWAGDVQIQRWRIFAWTARTPRFRKHLPESYERKETPTGFRKHILALIVLAITCATYGVLWIWSFVEDRGIFPAVGVTVLLGVFASVYGALVFHYSRRASRIWVVILIGAVLINSVREHRYTFAGLDYTREVKLERKDPPGFVIGDEEALDAWKRKAPRPILAVVAVSGGGGRAATWATAVLTRLEERIPGFPYHVRIITGASGGMLGSSYYVSTLRPPEEGGHGHDGRILHRDSLMGNISADSLTALTGAIVFPGVIDRGAALESEWEKNTGGALSLPLRDLARGEAEGWRPSLIFSPMMVEDGRRLIISNLDLPSLEGSRGVDLSEGKETTLSLSALQFHRLFPYAEGFKVCTAARMSATFPYVTPAGRLPTIPRRHVVDAGYYDNYGVSLAGMWMYRNREWIRENTSGVILIQIRDHQAGKERREILPKPGLEQAIQALGAVLAPPRAVLSAYKSTMSFRNDELLEFLNDAFNGDDPDFFATVAFEFREEAPLSWYLTADQRDTIASDVDEDVIRDLKEWWDRRGRP